MSRAKDVTLPILRRLYAGSTSGVQKRLEPQSQWIQAVLDGNTFYATPKSLSSRSDYSFLQLKAGRHDDYDGTAFGRAQAVTRSFDNPTLASIF